MVAAAAAATDDAGVFVACGLNAMASPAGNVTVQPSQLFVAMGVGAAGAGQQLPRLWVRLVVLGRASIEGLIMRDQRPGTTGPETARVRSGGAVYVEGALVATNVEFRRNHAPAGGGVFVQEGGRATLTNCRFFENVAEMAGHAGGGGVLTFGATTVTGCAFIGNTAGGAGGGVYGYGELTVSETVFASNEAMNGTVSGVPGSPMGSAIYFDEVDALSCAIILDWFLAVCTVSPLFSLNWCSLLFRLTASGR